MNTSSAETIRTTGNNRALSSSRPADAETINLLAHRTLSFMSYYRMPGGSPLISEEDVDGPAQPSGEDVPQGAFPEFKPATSARALMDVLALKTSLITVIPARDGGILHADEVVDERTLRALFAKALVWFLDRESIKLDGAYVVLVGQEASEETRTTHPGLPIDALWDLAAELNMQDAQNPDIVSDFDSFMYHTAKYLPRGYDAHPWAAFVFWATLSGLFMLAMYMYLLQMWNAFVV